MTLRIILSSVCFCLLVPFMFGQAYGYQGRLNIVMIGGGFTTDNEITWPTLGLEYERVIGPRASAGFMVDFANAQTLALQSKEYTYYSGQSNPDNYPLDANFRGSLLASGTCLVSQKAYKIYLRKYFYNNGGIAPQGVYFSAGLNLRTLNLQNYEVILEQRSINPRDNFNYTTTEFTNLNLNRTLIGYGVGLGSKYVFKKVNCIDYSISTAFEFPIGDIVSRNFVINNLLPLQVVDGYLGYYFNLKYGYLF